MGTIKFVRTEEYSIRELSNILTCSYWMSLWFEKWFKVAIDLDIPVVEIREWRRKQLCDILSLKELINEMLDYWANYRGKRATLNELFPVLEYHGLNELAEKLERWTYKDYKLPIKRQKLCVPFKHLEDHEVQIGSSILLSYSESTILRTGFMGAVVCEGRLNTRKRLNENSQSIQYVEREIALLNSASGHPHVSVFIGYKMLKGFPLPQATLKDWVEKTERGMEFQNAADVEILSQCLAGLRYIHEGKFAHGDLQPSNIMLHKLNEQQIVVKISCSNPDSSPGHLCWRSQEFGDILALANTEEKFQAGIKSDIFSLGCIFYYVITKGQHPFGDINQPSRLPMNIAMGTYNNLISRTFPLYESRGLLNLIKLMIDFLPEKRPPLEIVQSHPVFWETDKIFRFFGQINTFRWDTRTIIEKVFENFVNLAKEKNVLGNGWTGPANIRFKHDFSDIKQNNGVEYTESVQDLIRAIRNYGVEGHKNDRTTPIKIRFKTSIDNINDWLDLCPKLLPCAWISFKSLHAAGYSDLDQFYGEWKEEGDWRTFDGQKCAHSSVCKQLA